MNCTVSGNTTDDDTGRAGRSGGDAASALNCIFWGNDGGSSGEDRECNYGAGDVTYSTVEDCSSASGGLCSDAAYKNDDEDPDFVSSTDFRLQSGSPALNAGDVAPLIGGDGLPYEEFRDVLDINDENGTNELMPDLDLNPRLASDGSGGIDRGPYEKTLAGCAGDVDGDGVVDLDDLLDVLSEWGDTCPCDADLNGDDVVDFDDLLLVLGSWNCGNSSANELEDVLDCMDVDWDCWIDIYDDIKNGSSSVRDDAVCWLEHYESCHCPDTCVSGPAGCGPDPCGIH